MEEKFIKLCNIYPRLLLEDHLCIKISRDILYLCSVFNNSKTVLHLISRSDGHDGHGSIWEDCDVCGVTFSEEENEILVLSGTNNIKVYKLFETSLVFIKEISEEEMTLILGNYNIDFNKNSDISVYKFCKKYVILCIDKRWLVTLRHNSEGVLSTLYAVEVASCVTVVVDRNIVFTLTVGGNVSAYDIDTGQLLGVIHLYAMVPPSQVQEVLSFKYLTIDFDNKLLAVSDRASEVFLVKLKDDFVSDDINDQGLKWDCGTSVISFGSDSYRATATSRQQTKIMMDNISVSPSILQERNFEKSPQVTWNSYLQSLEYQSHLNDSQENFSSNMMRMLDPPLGLTVRALNLKNNELSVWYTEPDSRTGGIYYLHDLNFGSCIKEIVPDDTAIVPGGLLGVKDAFVSPRGLFMFLGSFCRDTLIGKLIHCMEMESLGRLLQGETWTNLTVPLPAVVSALGQKRLDIAQLALNLHVCGLKNTFFGVTNEDNKDKLDKQIEDFLELLEVIQKTCVDYNNKLSLREQLISLTLEQINCLLDFLCSSKQEVLFVQKLMLQVVEFRKYLVGNAAPIEIKEPASISRYCPEELLPIWQSWTEKDDDSVIQDAVLKNFVPLCQVFFINGRSWSKKAFHLKFEGYIDSWISSLIDESSLEEAERILKIVGKDPKQVLLEICVNAEHPGKRDCLAQHLTRKSWFPAPEANALKFLCQVEEILSIIDFSRLGLITNEVPDMIFDINSINVEISISKVLGNTEEWRQYVLISLFFNIPGADILESQLQAEYVWLFLLEHNRDDFLCLWITCSFSLEQFAPVPDAIDNWIKRLKTIPILSSSEGFEYIPAEHLLDCFKRWKISEAMVNSTTPVNAMSITKELVFNHLSRYGMFSDSEKSDVKSILKRTIFTGNVNRLQEVLSHESANVTFSEFQYMLTKHLIDNDLHEIAFPCLENFEYSGNQIEMLCNSDGTNSNNWFSLWLSCREMKRNPDDNASIHRAIFEGAKYLSRGNLKEYLLHHPLVVLALIMFEGKSIAEALTLHTEPMHLDEEVLTATLKHFPILEQAICSLTDGNEDTPDITVFDLLEKNSPFNVSNVLSWQQHKDSNEELPNFSSPRLVEKYGVEYQMTYLIYLRLARPSYAAYRFAVDQYQTYATLSQKRIKDAVHMARWLAIKHFYNIEITSSCLAFAEILGEDSNPMKVDLLTVKIVHKYLKSEGNEVGIKYFGDMVNGLIHESSNVTEKLLNLLEEALTLDLGHCQNPPLNAHIIEEIAHWGLAIKFARVHGLKLPEYFMRQLASENNLLLFLLFAEIYRYPLNQVKVLSQTFESSALQEHLFHLLQVEVNSESKPEMTGLVSRDSRKSILSKSLPKSHKLKEDSSLSLKTKRTKRKREMDLPDQQKEATEKLKGLAASLSSGSSAEETVGCSLISYDVWGGDEKDDIFIVLLKCHSTLDPLQALLHASYSLENPVLAVFATCYDPRMIKQCFCTWLMVSLPTSSSKKIETNAGLNSVCDLIWNEEHVSDLLEESVSINFIATLQLGCWIFLPDNPLGDLMDFLYEAIEMKDFEECAQKLKIFKTAFINLKSMVGVPENFMWSSEWLGSVAVNLCVTTLSSSLSSLYFILEFLNVLIEGNFLEHLPDPLPDLELMRHLVSCLELTDVYPEMSSLIQPSDSSLYIDEVNRCLKELVKSKQFSSALQFATYAGLNRDKVLIAQWSDKFEQSFKKTVSRDYSGFWRKCDEVFHKEKVLPHTAAQFFKDFHKRAGDFEERFLILQFAVLWLKKAAQNTSYCHPPISNLDIASSELVMWNCWLQTEKEIPLSDEDTSPELLHVTKEKVLEISGIAELQAVGFLETEEEKIKVHTLIGKLLDLGNLACACRVEKLYGLQNQDLRIILLCLQLAEGTISPYDLTAEQRLLFSEVPRTLNHKRRAIVSSFSSLSQSPGSASLLQDYVEIPSRDRQDTLSALEKFCARLKHGAKIGNRVTMCYRVAMNLDMNYLEILMLREPLGLLRTAISDDCPNKFIVASDVINAAQISSNDIAEFMAAEILEAVSKSKLKGEVSGTMMWGIDIETSFHLVLDLCKDQTALGKKLLTRASQCVSSKMLGFHDVHVICIELVIHAHNCFVAALNMEGIGSVLQECQVITNRLKRKDAWGLMVRLLTGVERYTEMQYIFKILYDSEQFEYLLAKGLDKFKGLKVAVVDYLKRRCPEDRKLCEMVSLRFSMYEEVASFWEKDGLTEEEAVLKLIVKDLKNENISLLPNTEAVKKHLASAMDCFKHAAEFFLKGDLMMRATRLVHHTELIALQRYFIGTVPPGRGAPLLLALNTEQVSTLVTNFLSFPQAYLVVRAYDHPVDWAAALYQHCVLDGNDSYFSSFISSIPLNSSLVEDIVKKFQINRNVTANNANVMKKFIERVDSLELKYRLASQLGFRDLIESLINGSDDDVAYLKDTVWQYGYQR